MLELPPTEVHADRPMKEYAGICGRWALMKEMDFGFTDFMMRKLAREEFKDHRFLGGLRKTLYGLWGGLEGFDEAGMEHLAENMDIYDDVWPDGERYYGR